MKAHRIMAAVLVAVITFFVCTTVQAQDAKPVQRPILRSQSFWRVRIWSAPWFTLLKNGELEPEPRDIPAPEGWAAPDFDDEAWVRVPGPFFPSHYNAGWIGWGGNDDINTALICVRGRFSVSDPKAVESVKLTVRYRGGAVAWLNGKEIGRSNMPEGEIQPNTPALAYPDEAFVVPGGGRAISGGFGDPKKYRDRINKRFRSLSVTIEPAMLRKGANVLALEFHRAPYNEIATKKKKKGGRVLKGGRGVRPYGDWWSTVAMLSADLRAAGSGIVPNVTRAPGFQVWNADPLLLIYDTDYGDAGVDPSPVRIVAARNGRHSGVLVTGCDKPITGLKGEISDLVSENGETIPASAVEIRYQLPGRVDSSAASRLPGGYSRHNFTSINWLDALSPEAPEVVKVRKKKLRGKQNVVFGAVCPVWFTVHVPEECKPGLYTGECAISASDVDPVKVPLKLEVCGWTLPPPNEFRTACGFHQSPESVAMYYDVPFWSDKHFKLLGESYRWLGSIGCYTLFAHLIERTNLGNAQSIVRWKRKNGAAADSTPQTPESGKKDEPQDTKKKKEQLPKVTLETHEPGFTALDRYLDTALDHLIDPPVICLYAWDNYCGTYYSGGAKSSHNVKPSPARVTELLADGTVRSALGPNYRDVDKAAAFWKPVGEHVCEYLKKRGLEKSLMIGLAHDSWPGKYVVDTWRKVLPESPWCFEGHPRCGGMYGVPVEWNCTVWGASWKPRGVKHGWMHKKMQNHFDRDNWRLDAQSQLLSHGHLVGEKNITGNQRGFGRMSADFWPVLKNSHGRIGRGFRTRSISARYPGSGWGACNLRQNPFLKPGQNGALSTGRLEMIRDGLQECEARIFIESALLSEDNRKKFGKEFVNRCRKLLNLRRSLIHRSKGIKGAIVFLGSGRQERVKKLYSLAGEIAQKIKE